MMNTCGNPIDQLKRCYNVNEDSPHKGILITIVGHHAEKLETLLRLFNINKPTILEYSVLVVCNGPDKIDESLMPENSVGPPIYRANTGWDIAMFAEAVLNYNFKYYWFMNDDVVNIKDGTWAGDFYDKIKRNDVSVVGVQAGSPYNFRTTYFGCDRLFFLSFYVACVYGVLRKDPMTALRHKKIVRVKNKVDGYMHAKAFEHYNLTFTRCLGWGHEWLNDHMHMQDTNLLSGLRSYAFERNPRPIINFRNVRQGLQGIAHYQIHELWNKPNPILKIPTVINFAEFMEAEIENGYEVI